jgi:PAS domain S-box-containing protein
MIDDTRLISRQLAYSLAAFMFVMGVIEFFLFTFGGTDKPPHSTIYVQYFAYVSCLFLTPVLLILGSRYEKAKLPAIVWFQVTSGVLLLFFSEIFSPFIALWSMLTLFASIYYGWKGFIGSSLSLCVIGVLYCVLFAADLKPNVFVYAGLSVMVIFMSILTSYMFMRIIMNGRKKNNELLKAQRSELMQVNRLNTLLNSISDAVMTLNRYGRITSQNAAAQAFFDTNESLIGRDIDTILKLTDQINTEVSIRSLIDTIKSTSLREDLSVGKGGNVRHLSVQLARIRSTFDDNEEYGVVIIIRDITKQKSLEEEKDEFISVTSHELRTPIAIAEGSLGNLMVMFDRGIGQDTLKDATKMAHDQVVYLANMINDLSTLSRAERGVGDSVEMIDVNAMLSDLYNRYTDQASAKNLQLNLDADSGLPAVDTSRLYLEEILQNFITNAIKYTKEGSVTIIAKLQDDGIRFAVSDTGIGMSKSDLEHIFEKFYRSEDYRTRETGGTGLGLYVVEKLALKLGTKINVESRLNFGSTFSFILPIQASAVTEEEAHDVTADQPPQATEPAPAEV